jgi:hypothetical protein
MTQGRKWMILQNGCKAEISLEHCVDMTNDLEHNQNNIDLEALT